MTDSLKDKSLAAFLWVLIDKLGGSVANFVVTIILARLLMPADFGLVALVLVFFEISSSFIQSGFGFALVREKTISEEDKSTAFIFNLLAAFSLYVVLFFSAPAIAVFFNQEMLTVLVRVMGLNLIIGSFSLVQHAVLTQKIDFKSLTKIRLLAVVVSGACAIVMAWKGFGVWSLVARIGVMELMSSLLLWALNPWKPALRFSKKSFRKLFGFGSKILAEALIDKAFRHLLQILIGKFYSAATLGFFAQANNFCNMAAGNFLQTIQKVTYPVLAKLQDDRLKLKDGYRQIITMSSFVIIPVMMLMGVLAEPLIVTLAGEKWRESVPFLQLLCVGGAVWHFNSINLDVLLVLGRVDLSLRLEIIKKAITAVAVIIGMQFGIYGLVAGQVVSVFIALFINTWYTDRLLGYSLNEQAKDVATTTGFSLLAGASVYLLQMLVNLPLGYEFLLGGSVGLALYGGLHWLARTKEMQFVASFIMPKAKQFFAVKT
jgi:O-antigen/teichoic acid export membrane protein